jgi:hypothetical protein
LHNFKFYANIQKNVIYYIRFNINATGNILWSKKYDFSTHIANKQRLTYDVIEDDSNSYVICGYLGLGIINDGAPFLLKLDTAGSVMWGYSYTLNSGYGGAHSLKQTSDNGYILGGSMGANASALIKTDNNGQHIWSKYYYQTNINDSKIKSVVSSNDGGYMLTGYLREGSDTSAYIIKTNSIGESSCGHAATYLTETTTETVTMSNASISISAIISKDTSVTMTETSVIPTITTYCSTIIPDKNDNIQSYFLYPNPTSHNAILQFNNPTKDSFTFLLYNTYGNVVKKLNDITTDNIIIERQALATGLYFFQLISNNKIVTTGKLVIE